MYRFVDDFGLPVTLTFDETVFRGREARHVLVFPFYEGKLLFTIHTKRGIELPGGKVEPGESSLAAAVRETLEETGCSLSAIARIGQYTVGDEIVKDIFVAKVDRPVRAITDGTVKGTVMFEEIPEQVKGDPRFSRYLYDEVYPLTLTHLRGLPLFPLFAS